MAALVEAAPGFLRGLADVESSFGRFAAYRGGGSNPYYWTWGNPAVRQVTRNVLGVGGTTGAVAGLGTLIARMFEPDTERYPKRARIDSDIVPRRLDFDEPMMDQLSVAAGNRTTKNRFVNKVRLKRGRLGRKLNKENEEYVQRFQRIYNFGANSTAYPTAATEENNPGSTVASWSSSFSPVNNASNTGRLMLSHVTDITQAAGQNWSLMPGYLFDITTWNNSAVTTDAPPMRRIAFDQLGNLRLITCSTQAGDFVNADFIWQPESGVTTTSLPNTHEGRGLLSWTDIRLALYGARTRCSKIHIEFVQFNDAKYLIDMYPDGEALANMTQVDRDDVNLFWMNEFKRLTFNPLVCNMFNRKKVLKVLRSETFCINANDTTNEDSGPPVVHKQYFKRFNRLVGWKWQTDRLTAEATKTNMDNPAYQVSNDTQLTNYAHPKSRIFMYIRAEDFEPVTGTTTLAVAAPTWSTTGAVGALPAQPNNTTVTGYYVDLEPNASYNTLPTIATSANQSYDRHVSFDIIVRNKWRIQN